VDLRWRWNMEIFAGIKNVWGMSGGQDLPANAKYVSF